MEGDTADVDTSTDEPRQKKGRHRKKQLYNSILSQMEFYFSDSNLSKDRFLSQLIKDDPNVELSIFLKFNKLRKLTTNLDDIRKALTKSTLLQVSEDGSKVYRITPIKESTNAEERTIYVERLKGDATHEWLTSIFSEFGKVVYVSIPKYKDANKGFAFIEFETETEAERALSYFESIDCKIPSNVNPEKIQSLAVYNEVGKNEDSRPKRKAKDEGDEHVAKKLKTEEEPQVDEAKDDAKDDENKKKKKLKKENKKRAHIKEFDLRVLSKREWRKMRNRYIDLQRKKMKEFKQYLAKQKYSRTPNYGDEVFKKPIEATEPIEDTAKKIEIVPGVIAKIKLSEPCLEPKKLKSDVKNASTDIQFVEVWRPPADDEVYVRFANAKACEEFSSQPYNGNKVEVLKGDEEKNYWDKVFRDREEKLKKIQGKQKKERGRDKLLRKANKLMAQHVKFDD